MAQHEFLIPKPLFLSFLFHTNSHLIVDSDEYLAAGDDVELIEVHKYTGIPTGRSLKRMIFQVAKYPTPQPEDSYSQITIVTDEQYNRLQKLPGLKT